MKLRRLSLLVFSVFLLFPFVSGDSFSVEDSNAISTDKEAYAAGETITVSGNLATSDAVSYTHLTLPTICSV